MIKKSIGILFVTTLSMAFVVENSSKKPEGGIKFSGLSLAKAKADAIKNDKVIFIDCHTSWCGPCKQMAATSFKDAEVATLFNSKFINMKVDIEKDADGPEIQKRYKISAYPTLLFLDGDGKVLKTLVGFQKADKLVSVASSFD